jgi:hypothetical protein
MAQKPKKKKNLLTEAIGKHGFGPGTALITLKMQKMNRASQYAKLKKKHGI